MAAEARPTGPATTETAAEAFFSAAEAPGGAGDLGGAGTVAEQTGTDVDPSVQCNDPAAAACLSPSPSGVGAPLVIGYGPFFDDPCPEIGSQGGETLGSCMVAGQLSGGMAAGGGRGKGRGKARGGGRGGARGGSSSKGGRPPSSDAAQGAPRWCKPLFVADPAKEDALLRASQRSGKEEDKNKILCRMCGHALSFSASSYTTAAKHVGTHGVTRDNLEVAVAFADRADDGGKPFPMQEWKDHLQAGAGLRQVATYMKRAPYPVGGAQWRETRAALARWIAADSMPMNLVESPAFRRFCTSLNGRCPGFSRKAISNKVSMSPNTAVCRLLLLLCTGIACRGRALCSTSRYCLSIFPQDGQYYATMAWFDV